MTQNKDLDPQTTREMLKEHIPYEFDMFFYAWCKLCKLVEIRERSLEEEKEKNMLLEVFLLHARNLIDFFRNHKDSVKVKDIFTNKDIYEKYTIISDEANKKIYKTNRISWFISISLSHISTARKTTEWHFEDKNDGFNLLYIFKTIKELYLLFKEDIKIIDQKNIYEEIIWKYNINMINISSLEPLTSSSPAITISEK